MRTYNELTEEQKKEVLTQLKNEGWTISTYHPENETGISKKRIGLMLKNIIVDSEWHTVEIRNCPICNK